MIDLHSHILPGVDDGAEHVADSLELARAALSEGTTVMAATPHMREDHPRVRPKELAGRCAELNEAMRAGAVPLEVVPGGEVDLLWAHRANDEELRLVTYGQRGSDLLLETPYGTLPPRFEDLVLAIARRGFRVLLAHPERSPALQRRPRRLAALVRRGVLVQVTAKSLLRGRRPTQDMAKALVKEGLAHVIASDAHRTSPAGTLGLAAGLAAATELAPEWAPRMVNEWPAAVAAGESLPRPVGGPRKRRWRGRVRGSERG